jgi:hypothetical protein
VKEKLTTGSPFFVAFLSDLIHEATKGVNLHFLIHNFTFGDELIMDSDLAIKKILQNIPANSGNFLKLLRK